MEKRKSRKRGFLVVLLLLIVGISIGYAALTSNININGNAKINNAKWDVHFANLVDDFEGAEIINKAEIDNSRMNINFNVSLKMPGDFYEFYVDVVNDGTIDAMLNKLTLAGLSDAQKGYIDYSLTYWDGSNLTVNDILKSQEKEKVKVYIKYKDDIDSTQLPSGNESLNLTLDLEYIQANDNATDRTPDKDSKSPVIRFSSKNENSGKNNWYYNYTVSTRVIDNGTIKSVKYCKTSNKDCTPDKSVTLVDNSFAIELENSKTGQKICVSAIDNENNETVKCSSNIMVDNEVPVANKITPVPDDDTMTVTIDATDNFSGVKTYYFSKDNGNTYIESENPNYTFINLEEKDYLVMGYVKDAAGNTSDTVTATVTIKHADFCNHNDINDLGDCLLASEVGTTDVEEAKTVIKAKGTPNFNITAPTMIYEEKVATGTSTVNITVGKIYVGTGYTFNPDTGYYSLTGYSRVTPDSIDYTKGDYFVLSDSRTVSNKGTMYKISNVSTKTAEDTGTVTYTLTKTNYTSNIISYDASEVGLYASTDNDGDTYYYRGSVGGNYVKFNNMYWRVIRVNGDGSIRMIYDGTSAHSNEEKTSNKQLTTKSFNSYYNDNTYVGYMYGDSSKFVETDSKSKTFSYTGLSATTKYVFGTSYEFDQASRSYKVAGTTHTGVLGTDQIGYYTCFSTNPEGKCQRLLYTTAYNSSNGSMTVKAKEFGTTNLLDAREKVTSSTMKSYLDDWYSKNLLSQKDKLSNNATFCNNTTKSTISSGTYTNEGYGINPTYYGYERFYSIAGNEPKGPTLACSNDDSYSVSATTGNGKLTYPIGLITTDEVNMAGGNGGRMNSLYYLHSGTTYWTMSPSLFNRLFSANAFCVASTGTLAEFSVNSGYGVRPVINLKTDNLSFKGTGTKEDPYVIE